MPSHFFFPRRTIFAKRPEKNFFASTSTTYWRPKEIINNTQTNEMYEWKEVCKGKIISFKLFDCSPSLHLLIPTIHKYMTALVFYIQFCISTYRIFIFMIIVVMCGTKWMRELLRHLHNCATVIEWNEEERKSLQNLNFSPETFLSRGYCVCSCAIGEKEEQEACMFETRIRGITKVR